MLRFIGAHHRFFRVFAVVLLVGSVILGVVWHFDPTGNYEPGIFVMVTLTGLIGVPTIAEAVSHAKSGVEIRSIGDSTAARPELMIIGLAGAERRTLVEVPITVANSGAEALSNLAIRVVLPSTLVPDVPPIEQTVENQRLRFETKVYDEYRTCFTFLIPSLRAGETCDLSFPLLLDPESWVEVEVGGRRTMRGKVALTKLERRRPLSLIGLVVSVSVFCDNARPAFRTWNVWLAHSKSLTELQGASAGIVEADRIWVSGHRAFRLPILGPFVFVPPGLGRRRDQSVVLTQFVKRAIERRDFDLFEQGSQFVLAVHGRRGVANPASRVEFWKWIRRVQAARPDHFRR